MDKIRAHREALKRAWFNMDHSKTPIRREIIVTLRDNPHWPGYGDVEIISDEPGSYWSMSSHQKNPIEYAKERMKEEKLKEFKLIIKSDE